jgi:hypothetical protein
VAVRTSIPQWRSSYDWHHGTALYVTGSVEVHELDISARVHVDGACIMSQFADAQRGFLTREAGGGGGNEGDEVEGSVEEGDRELVVGDSGNFAGFG